jgi:hydroxyethylthiazole kinase-like uncharacterized protein yjeF
MSYVVSALEMAELERQTAEELGIATRIMMEVAGRAVATEAARGLASGARVIVACGPGNNGGDGFVAARALASMGFAVSVYVFAERARLHGDAKACFSALEKLGSVPVRFVDDARVVYDFSSALRDAALVIDALLGTGSKGELRGIIGDAIDVINDAGVPIVAVDIPSGVDADTGEVPSRAVNATRTVTFAFAKRGHYMFPGAENRGELSVADIGIPSSFADKLGIVVRVLRAEDGPTLLKRRPRVANKGKYGRVIVIAGHAATPGAALLALSGALRSGAGLVNWATDEATVRNAPSLPPEVMLRLRAEGQDDETFLGEATKGADALVLGPGLSTNAAAALTVRRLLRMPIPMCLDADGLNLLAENPGWWQEVQAPLVLTPHPKEMSRLTGASVDDVQRDRVAMALQLAVARQCTVVLKGAGTVIADSDGSVTVIDAGNPGMSVGGTGDVLAGIVAGYLAQGFSPGEAARLGTLVHSCAGDIAAAHHGEAGLRPTDLIEAMGELFVQWHR